MPRWQPSRLITLLTDFGHRDPYVGIVKGVIASTERGLEVVDLTHGVAPQDVRSASFHLAHSWRWFPPGTVHVAVVDPGVGTARRILCARAEGHVFLAPDNGLLGPVLPAGAEVRALDLERFSLPGRSRTFHGRDVFAPAAARIASGLPPEECGTPAAGWQDARFPEPERGDRTVRGEVLLADHFGNLITNVREGDLPGPPEGWTAHAGEQRARLVGAYAEAAPGELVALVDSFGYWELSEAAGSAAARLGLGRGSPVRFTAGR